MTGGDFSDFFSSTSAVTVFTVSDNFCSGLSMENLEVGLEEATTVELFPGFAAIVDAPFTLSALADW